MPISVVCECGKRLKVKDEAAGKRIRCPGCGTVLEVPSAEAIGQASEPSEKKPVSGRSCPWCTVQLPDDAVVCLSCGYDFRTGRKAAAVKQEKPPSWFYRFNEVMTTEVANLLGLQITPWRLSGLAGVALFVLLVVVPFANPAPLTFVEVAQIDAFTAVHGVRHRNPAVKAVQGGKAELGFDGEGNFVVVRECPEGRFLLVFVRISQEFLVAKSLCNETDIMVRQECVKLCSDQREMKPLMLNYEYDEGSVGAQITTAGSPLSVFPPAGLAAATPSPDPNDDSVVYFAFDGEVASQPWFYTGPGTVKGEVAAAALLANEQKDTSLGTMSRFGGGGITGSSLDTQLAAVGQLGYVGDSGITATLTYRNDRMTITWNDGSHGWRSTPEIWRLRSLFEDFSTWTVAMIVPRPLEGEGDYRLSILDQTITLPVSRYARPRDSLDDLMEQWPDRPMDVIPEDDADEEFWDE